MTKPFSTTLKLAVAAAAVAVAPSSFAANAVASGAGTVVQPIAITAAGNLEFGKFAAVTGGTVTVSTSGARTVGGSVLAMTGVSTTAAKFDVTGEADATFSISLSAPANLSTGGGDTMAFATVSDLTAANTITGNATSGTLTLGAQSIYVGGILTVASSQAPGTYNGNITATVEYN